MDEEIKTKDSSTTFTYRDPSRNFDGTPYQAAAQAVVQTDAVLRLALRSLRDTAVQARNAYMQANLDTGDEPNAAAWPESAQARTLARMVSEIVAMRKKLAPLLRAVAYDPKNPPKEDD